MYMYLTLLVFDKADEAGKFCISYLLTTPWSDIQADEQPLLNFIFNFNLNFNIPQISLRLHLHLHLLKQNNYVVNNIL